MSGKCAAPLLIGVAWYGCSIGHFLAEYDLPYCLFFFFLSKGCLWFLANPLLLLSVPEVFFFSPIGFDFGNSTGK